ncbi:MAG: V-type ATP synthase subunit E [Candidatus Micrarchaeota archaeon]|nr:V-type ATP synthase subunit E [Candidatus Micrarchaeota archaeon]
MGIEKLTSSLLSEAKNEANEIVKAAEWHVEKMFSEEKAKRVILLKNAEEDAGHLIGEYEQERVAWSRLEAKRVIAEGKEDAVREALDRFFDILATLRKSPEYKNFLKNAMKSAIEQLKGTSATVHCVKGEKSLFSSLVNSNTKVVEDLDSLGGFVVESSDRKSKVDATFESIFESKKDDLRKYFYERLFADEKPKKSVGRREAIEQMKSAKDLPNEGKATGNSEVKKK